MDNINVIIIGSGLGGLLCGYILSKEGFKVCILEKEPRPGGNLLTFSRQGHPFETGVHYIGAMGPGQTLHRYWNYFELVNNLKIKQLDTNVFDLISLGEREFPMAQGFDNFTEQLLPFFPGARSYLSDYTHELQHIVSKFALYNLEVPASNLHPYADQSALTFFNRITAGIEHTDSGIRLSDVLGGNNFLYGGHVNSPLNMAALINHSFISGAYRIVGGSDIIAKILVSRIEAMGGSILTRQQVSAIEHANSQFTIRTTSNNVFRSGLLIAAIHPSNVIAMMQESSWRPAFRKRMASLKNTTSPFILHILLKPGTFPYLNYNYYHHSQSDPWHACHPSETTWPSMFMLSTACHSMEQQYAETVTVMTYMSFEQVRKWEDTFSGRRGQDYTDFKTEHAERLLEMVSGRFPTIRESMLHMTVSTPLTYRDFTGTVEGSLYGIQRNFLEPEATFLATKTRIPGFFFTGQNINLHGVLGVTIGSVMTCSEILGYEYLLNKIKSC